FFSSRRRHTIFSRDWSSDVCSSDLPTFTFPSIRIFLRKPTRQYVRHFPTPLFTAMVLLLNRLRQCCKRVRQTLWRLVEVFLPTRISTSVLKEMRPSIM